MGLLVEHCYTVQRDSLSTSVRVGEDTKIPLGPEQHRCNRQAEELPRANVSYHTYC